MFLVLDLRPTLPVDKIRTALTSEEGARPRRTRWLRGHGRLGRRMGLTLLAVMLSFADNDMG